MRTRPFRVGDLARIRHTAIVFVVQRVRGDTLFTPAGKAYVASFCEHTLPDQLELFVCT